MEFNFTGLASAMAISIGVWLGHVSVRKIEREVERIWIPSVLALSLGIGLELVSFWTTNRALSTVCGILGMTLLWDSYELYRQQKRIGNGHAPANPNNPRHVRILATHPHATTIDWLERSPRGLPYSKEELGITEVESA